MNKQIDDFYGLKWESKVGNSWNRKKILIKTLKFTKETQLLNVYK